MDWLGADVSQKRHWPKSSDGYLLRGLMVLIGMEHSLGSLHSTRIHHHQWQFPTSHLKEEKVTVVRNILGSFCLVLKKVRCSWNDKGSTLPSQSAFRITSKSATCPSLTTYNIFNYSGPQSQPIIINVPTPNINATPTITNNYSMAFWVSATHGSFFFPKLCNKTALSKYQISGQKSCVCSGEEVAWLCNVKIKIRRSISPCHPPTHPTIHHGRILTITIGTRTNGLLEYDDNDKEDDNNNKQIDGAVVVITATTFIIVLSGLIYDI